VKIVQSSEGRSMAAHCSARIPRQHNGQAEGARFDWAAWNRVRRRATAA
jgi:hypothetical protein